MPWQTFHAMNDEFAKKASSSFARFPRSNIDSNTLELLRSLLLNRTSQIIYTKDKLLFLILQKKFAKRQKWLRQSFNFEATYYLSYYYFVLWGGIDQLSRILKEILDIQIYNEKGKRTCSISIGDSRFVKKIIEKSQLLGELYEDSDFVDWIQQLAVRRHFVAHEGCAMLSPLVEELETGISDDDLEKEILEDLDFSHLRNLFPDEDLEPIKSMFKEGLRASKYKVILNEAMVVKEKTKTYIFLPLDKVGWDFENYKRIITLSLEILNETLDSKK